MSDIASATEELASKLLEKLGNSATENQMCQLVGHAAIATAILEAVRALKPQPAPIYKMVPKDEEIERLRAELTSARESLERADRVNDQLRAEKDELKAERDSQREIWNMPEGNVRAELQRFREREPLVTKLIGKAICANYPSGTCEAAAAVRDFKVTDNG